MTAPTTQSVRKSIMKPNRSVACRVYLSADASGLTANSWNKIAFNTAVYDLGSNFDLTNHKFVVPVTGLYKISCLAFWKDGQVVANKRYGVAVYINTTSAQQSFSYAGATGGFVTQVHDELYLQKDDVIEFYVYPEQVGNTAAIYGSVYLTFANIRLITLEGIRQ